VLSVKVGPVDNWPDHN